MPQLSERALLFLVGAVQFVNILDFMMVMPLGPDFAAALGIPTSNLGLVGGSYTAAAAAAGVAGSLFLDRFDRRSALAVAMLGLVLATAAGGFATGLGSLLAARILAGAFGGPATSIAFSIVADVVPPERRGKALGAVMGAFSVASVLGVPIGLELARHGGFRLPFFAVAGLGLVVAAAAIFSMPPMRTHLSAVKRTAVLPFRAFLFERTTLLSLSATASVMIASFTIVPNLSAYIQFNAGYPRARLGLLYLIGGCVSFAAMRATGILVDRFGAAVVAAGGTGVFVAALATAFLFGAPVLPVVVVFPAFMLANATRNVPMSTVSSRVPLPSERARFLSVQSAVQHVSAASGAFLSAKLLHELGDGKLEGMRSVALVSMSAALALPVLLQFVERSVRRREAKGRAAS